MARGTRIAFAVTVSVFLLTLTSFCFSDWTSEESSVFSRTAGVPGHGSDVSPHQTGEITTDGGYGSKGAGLREQLKKPTADTTVFVYTGSEQTYVPVGFDEITMTITGNRMTCADYQDVTVSIINKANYEWDDGTQSDVWFPFIINPKNLPTPEVIADKTYDGTEQPPTLRVMDGPVTLLDGRDYSVSWSDTGFKNAGTYIATIYGEGNYYTTQSQIATYTISKAQLSKPTADTTIFTYDGEEKTY